MCGHLGAHTRVIVERGRSWCDDCLDCDLDRLDFAVFIALDASADDVPVRDLVKRFDANRAAGLLGGRAATLPEWLGLHGGAVRIENDE